MKIIFKAQDQGPGAGEDMGYDQTSTVIQYFVKCVILH